MSRQQKNTFLENVTVSVICIQVLLGTTAAICGGRFGPPRGIYCEAQLSVEVKEIEDWITFTQTEDSGMRPEEAICILLITLIFFLFSSHFYRSTNCQNLQQVQHLIVTGLGHFHLLLYL